MANLNDESKIMDNVKQLPNRAVIKEEAGRWLIRIDEGDLSEREVAQFQEWITQSEFHRLYMEKLAQNWDSMAVLAELAELFPLSDVDFGHSSASNTGRWSAMSRLNITWATSVIMLLGAMLFLFMGHAPTEEIHIYATKIGQQTDYTLTDGTVLSLNTNSRVEVDFSGDMRVVKLEKGEANFAVAKNPNRPFVVYAGKGLVWAVGTRFNVRYTSDDVDVTVTEGVIKVFANVNIDEPLPKLSALKEAKQILEREAIVEAGQKVVLSQSISRPEKILPEKLDQSLAWQKGALVFRGETLEQAVHEIARYIDKELVIVDPSIRNIRVGGHYKTDDVRGLLATLSRGFDIKITEMPGNRIHISKNADSK